MGKSITKWENFKTVVISNIETKKINYEMEKILVEVDFNVLRGTIFRSYD